MKTEIEVTFVDQGADDDGWERTEWRCLLTRGDRAMTVPFFTGLAHTEEPTADQVVGCLMSDASAIEYASVDEWIEDMGVEISSVRDVRKWEATYQSIGVQTLQLRALLGDDFDSERDRLAEAGY